MKYRIHRHYGLIGEGDLLLERLLFVLRWRAKWLRFEQLIKLSNRRWNAVPFDRKIPRQIKSGPKQIKARADGKLNPEIILEAVRASQQKIMIYKSIERRYAENPHKPRYAHDDQRSCHTKDLGKIVNLTHRRIYDLYLQGKAAVRETPPESGKSQTNLTN